MRYIAHRGYKKNSKENSLDSFVNAINDSYFAGFELDIRESKDKKIVVIHDHFINRVTNESGLVKDINYNKLKKLGIPNLEEVLNLKTDKIILIEIKDYDMNLKKLSNLLNKYKNKRIYVCSFSKKVIDKLLKYNISFKVGLLEFKYNKIIDYSKYNFISLYKDSVTNKVIEYFINRQKEVFIWDFSGKIKLGNNIINKDKLYLIVNNKM